MEEVAVAVVRPCLGVVEAFLGVAEVEAASQHWREAVGAEECLASCPWSSGAEPEGEGVGTCFLEMVGVVASCPCPSWESLVEEGAWHLEEVAVELLEVHLQTIDGVDLPEIMGSEQPEVFQLLIRDALPSHLS